MKSKLILTFLACGASLMLGAAAQAQSPALVSSTDSSPSASPGCSPGEHKHGFGGPGKRGGLLEDLTNSLGLSGSQQAEIAPILQAARPQMKAIRDEAQAKRKALIDSVSTQITPLLTPDQLTKFTQMVQNVENGPAAGGPPGPGGRGFARAGGSGKFSGPGGPGGGPGPAPGELLQRLTSQLNLTAGQQSQIKPILEAAHTQIQSIRENTSLTPAEKFAQVKETMKGVHGQIDGILTPEQKRQLGAMKEKWRPNAGQTPAPAVSGTN